MNSFMQPFFINYQNHILAVSARAIWAAKGEHSNLCEASVYVEYGGRRNGEILMIWIWILSRKMINSTRSCSFWLASFFFLSISIDHQFPPASVIKVKRRQVHYDAINYLLRLHFSLCLPASFISHGSQSSKTEKNDTNRRKTFPSLSIATILQHLMIVIESLHDIKPSMWLKLHNFLTVESIMCRHPSDLLDYDN